MAQEPISVATDDINESLKVLRGVDSHFLAMATDSCVGTSFQEGTTCGVQQRCIFVPVAPCSWPSARDLNGSQCAEAQPLQSSDRDWWFGAL